MPKNARLIKRRAQAAAAAATAATAASAANSTADLAKIGAGGGSGAGAIVGADSSAESSADGGGDVVAFGPLKKLTGGGGGGSRADPISLTINFNALRMSDVQLLHGPHWLNEAVMNFYFAYLDELKYKANGDFMFVTPEMAQCMLYMDEKELELLLPRKPFIFFALSDSQSQELGGAHWSLLVASRPDKAFFHFDSYGGNHTTVARELVNNAKDVLDLRQARFRPTRCLQQSNGYDCGIHVICMADQVADYVNRYESVDGVPVLQLDVVKAKRSELLKLIASLGGRI